MERECTLGDLARARPWLANEYGFTHQVLGADVRLLGERMAGIGDHHELVLSPGYDIHPLVRNGTLYQRDIRARLEEESEHGSGVGARDANTDRWVSHVEATEDWWKHVRGDGSACGDAERSAFEASELTEFLLGNALDSEQLPRTTVERLSGVGEVDASRTALEQRDMKLSLQFVEGLGDSGLAEVEHPGGLGESALLDYGGEEAKVVEVHDIITLSYGSMKTMYWTHSQRNEYRPS